MSSYIGILAIENDKPQFVFSKKSGDTWIFISSGSATFSESNKIATYPISYIQESSGTYIQNKGECKISNNAGTEIIECIAWKD